MKMSRSGVARLWQRGIFGMVLWSMLFSTPLLAEEIHVAVASNFSNVIKQLGRKFEDKTGNKIVVSLASTGKLYAQIRNGAPYEIFLSADSQHPQLLVEQELAVADSLFVYARGHLVLWSAQKGLVDREGNVLLKIGQLNHLSVANPKTAPYGTAAQQTLEKLGLWDKWKDKVVQAENISQAYQFIASGNAELGFIALSQYKEMGEKIDGSYWFVPDELHSPIEQAAVLLKTAEHNEVAKNFLDFLKSPAAQDMIEQAGYSVLK